MDDAIYSRLFEARESRADEASTNSFVDAVWNQLRNSADGAQKLVRDAAEAAALPAALKDFSEKNQLTVTKQNNNFNYVLKAYGKDVILFKTSATLDGLKEGQSRLDKLISEKQKELEKQFKVKFAAENEFVFDQKIQSANCSVSHGGPVTARKPTMHELTGVEAGFAHAAPTHLSNDGKQGLKIYFLQDTYYKGDAAIAYYIEEDKDKRPALYFDPGGTTGVPATEQDAKLAQYHYSGRLIDSVSAVIIHECAHNEQNNQKLDLSKNYAALSKELGWVAYLDPKTKATKYLLEGKDGKLYKYHQDDCSQPKQWVISDREGNPLAADGKPTNNRKDYQTIEKKDLRVKAKVAPATIYFNNLYEEHAEAATAFRIDADRRGQLLRESPVLYGAVKRWDDEAIMNAYGLDTSKRPLKIRNADGLIVDNTEVNRKALAAWEAARRQ